MPNTATVTAKIGPGLTATAVVCHNVTNISFNESAQVVQVTCDEGNPIFSLYEIATITYTVSSHNATITLTT